MADMLFLWFSVTDEGVFVEGIFPTLSLGYAMRGTVDNSSVVPKVAVHFARSESMRRVRVVTEFDGRAIVSCLLNKLTDIAIRGSACWCHNSRLLKAVNQNHLTVEDVGSKGEDGFSSEVL
jgi:hypothetical protein